MSSAAVVPQSEQTQHDTLGAEPRKMAGLPLHDIAIRFLFGSAVSAIAGVVGVLVGPRAGGALLAFPAILPAALTLIERREGTSQAVSDVRGAAIGAVAMLGFAIVVLFLGARLPLGGTLVVAACAWIAVAVAVYWSGIVIAGLLHEQHYLPDVAVSELQPLVRRLRERHLTLAIAESCTGGSLAALLASFPGASEVFRGAIVAYTNEVKQEQLGVDSKVLERDGAISETTARQMARGVRTALQADVGIGITGAVGTSAEGKPPGLVFVAISDGRSDDVVCVQSDSNPERGRGDSIRAAIRLADDLR